MDSAVASAWAAGSFLGRVIYNSSYAVSYAVVFPVMLVVQILPKNNAIVHGLIDGALAARDTAAGWGRETVSEDLSGTEDHPDEQTYQSHDGEVGDTSKRTSRRRTGRQRAASRSTRGSQKK
jgi:hypothetical protein